MLIGLTGGIAAGKTLVSNRFASRGVPIIDADLLAREVVEPGTPGLVAIVKRFGASVLQSDGSLDRSALRTIVFSDGEARSALDGILHPRIRALSQQRIGDARRSGAPYVIYAVPLLVETDQAAHVDRIALVDVPEAVQLARLIARDGGDEVAARRVMAAQATRAQRLAVADDIIDNAGSQRETFAQVDALDVRYRAMAVGA